MNKLDDILNNYDFFTGVPDSGLTEFIINIDDKKIHIPATNEGQAIGIAVGAELAGKKSCVYLQNSGLGNIINPLTSLCIPHGIYPFLVIGHRHTLPQHKVMGKVDEDILKLIGYENYLIVRGDNNVS
tara:strand:+ start:14921 stop:15304 length:384 start_codon:yes stop_codon:yes gene_type:complete